MKIAGLIINIFFPGIGTIMAGKTTQGIIQIVLIIIGIICNLTLILAIIGIPLCFITWIWGIVSAATALEGNKPES